MKSIRYTNTLVYYDGVQVFAAEDTDGDRYVGVMVGNTGEADHYLIVATAPEPLRKFYAGELDLRTLLKESSSNDWYTALVSDDFKKPVSLELQQGPLPATGYLPGPGFRLHGAPVDQLMAVSPKGQDAAPDASEQTLHLHNIESA